MHFCLIFAKNVSPICVPTLLSNNPNKTTKFYKTTIKLPSDGKMDKRLKISVVNSNYFIDFFLNWVKTRKCFCGVRKFIKIGVKSNASIKL